ncbi:MAG: ABC transporter ATP-binding protein [Clostridia bacterium]|nr:ABC transporter ATP-binding protein [Clostridia bacterium]
MVIKTLAKSIRNYKRDSILTPVLVAIEVILECLLPFAMAEMIDYINPPKTEVTRLFYFFPHLATSTMHGEAMTIEGVLCYAAILVAMAILSLLCGMGSGWFCASAAEGYAKNLRHDLFGAVQRFSFANIDKFSTSSLVTRLTTDVTNVEMSYMMIIRMAIRCPLMLVFSMTMAFITSPRVAWVFAVVVPVLTVSAYFLLKTVHKLFQRVFKKYDRLNETVQENVHAARVVKAYVREDYETQKFTTASDDICRDFTKAEKIIALNGPIMMAAIYVCMLMIAIIGATVVVKTNAGIITTGTLTTGGLMSMINYVMQILMSFIMIGMCVMIIAISTASADRVVEVLNEQPTIVSPENPVREVKDGSVDFDDVSFRYSATAERDALSHVDLHVPSGAIVGVLGGTGSAKSTLVQLIPRLYDVSQGAVKVGGVDVRKYELDVLRNKVAMVLQKNVLFSGTIAENLRWGNEDATDEQLREACRLAQADAFVESFPDGYNTRIAQGGTNVSGGQRQRLCIARALLKDPKILILDDSTSAVDTKTDSLIRQGFRDYIPDVTKIIIAQRIASVQDADIIVVMDNGKIDAVGKHEELLASNEIYREVYFSQNREGGEDNA